MILDDYTDCVSDRMRGTVNTRPYDIEPVTDRNSVWELLQASDASRRELRDNLNGGAR